ncbi:helix-turn-helix transcriptional regulator [Pseudoduganella umbonata]|uniref:AlpA family phage regulatory protein n=1 Tax=Pseudoduganella umbonata TaxID=864828 RepID=A0A4P8HHW7_9BURK|nr:AlpA family phage regulatory protein [Pseudoduganella umbonata]MBB3221723.1 prophage regulatory protein [Pseudoduganella umbonata]QCP09057.1 AlpA family phage regulatory protein [Pseudoduganella umbonata]
METFQERRSVARTTHLTLIRLKEVIRICGLSRSSVYEAIKTGQFPRPVAIGGRARAWIRHEVENWMGQKIRQTRGASTAAKGSDNNVAIKLPQSRPRG